MRLYPWAASSILDPVGARRKLVATRFSMFMLAMPK
jgi:hypothetical protein